MARFLAAIGTGVLMLRVTVGGLLGAGVITRASLPVVTRAGLTVILR